MKFIRILKSNKEIQSAVSDLPQDLVDVINTHARGGMKKAMEVIYHETDRDLNKIELSSDTITKTDKVHSSDLLSKDRAIFILISDGSRKTLVLAGGKHYPVVLGGDVEFEVNGRYLDIRSSDRNVARVLNNYPYQAWVIDLSKAEDVTELRKKRYQPIEDPERRYTPEQQKTLYYEDFDSSGYMRNKNKYKDKLRQLRQENNVYGNQLIELYSQLSEVFNKRMLSPKDKRISIRELRDAFTAFTDAVDYAEDNYLRPETIQKQIDEAKMKIESLEK